MNGEVNESVFRSCVLAEDYNRLLEEKRKLEELVRFAKSAFNSIEWSNDSSWQSDMARVALAKLEQSNA